MVILQRSRRIQGHHGPLYREGHQWLMGHGLLTEHSHKCQSCLANRQMCVFVCLSAHMPICSFEAFTSPFFDVWFIVNAAYVNHNFIIAGFHPPPPCKLCFSYFLSYLTANSSTKGKLPWHSQIKILFGWDYNRKGWPVKLNIAVCCFVIPSYKYRLQACRSWTNSLFTKIYYFLLFITAISQKRTVTWWIRLMKKFKFRSLVCLLTNLEINNMVSSTRPWRA